jgi:selenium metabolism protein YedF
MRFPSLQSATTLNKEANMISLDCLGMPCPQPVLRVKESLAQGVLQIEVLVDNEAAKNNILRFAHNQGHTATSNEQPNGGYAIIVTAAAGLHTQQTPAAHDAQGDQDTFSCAPHGDTPPVRTSVCVISSDSMGRGNEELGWALLQTYIQTIKEVQPLPQKILLYNSGVKLLAAPSGALEAFKHLQAQGVEILACGTCLDFFKLKSAMQVGQISNMYDIMQAMSSADAIVSPY